MRKIPFDGIELTSQRVRGLRRTSELPGLHKDKNKCFFRYIIHTYCSVPFLYSSNYVAVHESREKSGIIYFAMTCLRSTLQNHVLGYIICIYVNSQHNMQQSLDQTGMVANRARGRLNRENIFP